MSLNKINKIKYWDGKVGVKRNIGMCMYVLKYNFTKTADFYSLLNKE